MIGHWVGLLSEGIVGPICNQIFPTAVCDITKTLTHELVVEPLTNAVFYQGLFGKGWQQIDWYNLEITNSMIQYCQEIDLYHLAVMMGTNVIIGQALDYTIGDKRPLKYDVAASIIGNLIADRVYHYYYPEDEDSYHASHPEL